MAALLALQHVSKAFGSLQVIDELTLEVGEREAPRVIGRTVRARPPRST